MTDHAKADRFGTLVRSGKIQTLDQSVRKAAAALAKNPASSREDRLRFADTLRETGHATARLYTRPKARS
ncbi:hypothetical protein [Rhodospira trueperi]|uniref:Uncharacterized protein n=1 Tax=Rhodospira trueperi TaxID=69960 RepID=A0A1G6WHD3_9PROT|nr:hypothetical protein [Rhodospira trueperi]SDD65221.1 hypothetical protein SAMN05421720_101155 [Rhodospira trueperi]